MSSLILFPHTSASTCPFSVNAILGSGGGRFIASSFSTKLGDDPPLFSAALKNSTPGRPLPPPWQQATLNLHLTSCFAEDDEALNDVSWGSVGETAAINEKIRRNKT